MPAIRYILGDAALPVTRPAMIVHVVNDAGFWGAGFTASLDRHWPTARRSYVNWTARTLGAILVAPLAEDVHLVHLCAQHGVRSARNPKPLRLDALDRALAELAFALEERTYRDWRAAARQEHGAALAGIPVTPASTVPSAWPLHMPRIGCGLAGGAWHEVEPLLRKHLDLEAFAVTVYR